MATAAQLATQVAQHLNYISAGQTLATADQTIITDAYASVYEELNRDKKVDWGIDDDIPEWAELLVRDIVANRVAKTFGRQRDLNEEMYAYRMLAKGLQTEDSKQPTQVEHF